MGQLRARKKGDSYELTKKAPIQEENISIQIENTIPINQEEFDYLYTYLPYKIKKERYLYKENDISYEIDIFQEKLAGLVLIDVEFEKEVHMDNFSPPKFLGKEVTQDRRFAGGILCQTSEKKAKKLLKNIVDTQYQNYETISTSK